jgi:hypothetical protein
MAAWQETTVTQQETDHIAAREETTVTQQETDHIAARQERAITVDLPNTKTTVTEQGIEADS